MGRVFRWWYICDVCVVGFAPVFFLLFFGVSDLNIILLRNVYMRYAFRMCLNNGGSFSVL